MLVGSFEMPRVVHGSNVDVKKALEQAVKGAALCINEQSLVDGQTVITPSVAYEHFEQIMQLNLGLDAGWQPLEGSGIEEVIEYQFVVLNGENNSEDESGNSFSYEPEGYRYDNSSFGVELNSINLPMIIKIDGQSGINGLDGDYETTVKSPSCIAWVKVKLKNVLAEGDSMVTRWGVGRLYNKSDS